MRSRQRSIPQVQQIPEFPCGHCGTSRTTFEWQPNFDSNRFRFQRAIRHVY